MKSPLPEWSSQIISLYESQSASQLILAGNVNDRFLLGSGGQTRLGSLQDYLEESLLPAFDVVISYDLGNGIRLKKGERIFRDWEPVRASGDLPRAAGPAVDMLTRFFRHCAAEARRGKPAVQIGCVVRAVNLIAPSSATGSAEVNGLVLLIREWADDALFEGYPLVTCLVSENLNDMHPLLVNNPRCAKVRIDLPLADEIEANLKHQTSAHGSALGEFRTDLASLARQLVGATNQAVDRMVKLADYHKRPIAGAELVSIKRQMVEEDSGGLVEFIQAKRTLDDYHGQPRLKEWLRQDIALWQQNRIEALPKGYLICGPVGTGKTYLVECLAGEAGVPVVKIKNFRDKWVGSTEGNLEKIFGLLHALDRCYVFIDEADQSLGKRDAGGGGDGLSGRIYSMMAQEMSRPENRGRIIWVLASSRPDLIEVDLKRPGRIDLKIPIFPSSTPEESFHLIRALCRKQGIEVPEDAWKSAGEIPLLLTPGAAEAIAVKVYRLAMTRNLAPAGALAEALVGYQNPVAPEIMRFQIGLAVGESSDAGFVPPAFQGGLIP